MKIIFIENMLAITWQLKNKVYSIGITRKETKMFTYQMVIINQDDCTKIVYVTADNFVDAIKNMRLEYGRDWVVSSSKIISASY